MNFTYWQFAVILLINGLGMGLFASPNRAGIMNSLPPERRGVGAGMSATFQNSATVLSIGIFFTLIILGLASTLPHDLSTGHHPGVAEAKNYSGIAEIKLHDEAAAQQILAEAVARGTHINRFEVMEPTLEEIFIENVRASFGDAEAGGRVDA